MVKQRTKLQRHEEYLRAKARGKIKSWSHPRKYETFSSEEKERRRINSAKWRSENPDKVKDNMHRWREIHGSEERKSAQEYRRNNKKLAIEYLGGRCVKCGGAFHPDVYDFHHKDEKEKDRKGCFINVCVSSRYLDDTAQCLGT